MSSILQSIKHEPYGLEHPYQKTAIERLPRDPQAGQSVSLGFATQPRDAAEHAWVKWSGKNKSDPQTVQAILKEEDENGSYWQAVLPSLEEGKVSYQFFASQGERQVNSDVFHYYQSGWYSIQNINSITYDSDHINLFCTSNLSTFSPLIQIFFTGKRLTWKLHAGLEVKPETNPPHSYTILDDTSEALVIQCEAGRFEIKRNSCLFSIRDHQNLPILIESRPPAWLLGEEHRPLAVAQSFFSPEQEGFYGFGERFNAVNQRGNSLDILVYEQYKNQGLKTYMPVSFFFSSHGYGMYLRTNRVVHFDLATKDANQWGYQAQIGIDGTLAFELLIEDQPIKILREYSNLTSKPSLPPSWAFGPWMSSNEWNTQASVMEQVQLTLENDIPATVLVIEAWSDETTFYIWNDAQYSPKSPDQPLTYKDFTFPTDGRWPDPKGMIDELHRRGIRLVLWQIPVLKKTDQPHTQHDGDREYALAHDFIVREADDSPYKVRPFWFHDSFLWDPSTPESVEWWMNKRAYLLEEMGVDGFKTDGGEHLWGRDTKFSNGMSGDEGINLYPNLYVGAYHRFAAEKRQNDALTFSRAGFSGTQAFPCHWAGDEDSTWEAMRASLTAGLNSSLSGIPFWGWDIAGFSGEIPTAELYLRATAMATFMPVMQYHSEFNNHQKPNRDRTPWNIAERCNMPEVIDIYRKFSQLRMRLIPYIEAEAKHCSETGEPMMRPLFLNWPDDPHAWQVTDQYLFGREILIAPILEQDVSRRKIYLPAGEWLDFWTGDSIQGGQWIERDAPLDSIPAYQRTDGLSSRSSLLANVIK